MDNGTVAGILTETDVLTKVAGNGKDFYQTELGQIMSCPVETVRSDLSVLDAGRIMGEKNIKRLPILEGEKLIGIVTQTDLVRALTSYGLWRDVLAIMSPDVAAIQRNASVAEATEVMTAQNISCIVVLDGDQVAGVLTEKDLLGRVVALQRDPACVKTEEVMSSPVTSIPPSYSVFSASKIMEEMNIRRLVVTKDERLCGVVTQTDIFMAVRNRLQAEEEKNLRLLENSKDSIYTTDLDGMITYVNPAFMKLLDVSEPANLINQPFLPKGFCFSQEERKQFLKELKKGSIESKELTLKTSGGKKIYVTVFPSFTKDIHGKINGSQGIIYDVTAKKELVALREAEEALQQSEERLRIILNSILTGVVLIDAESHEIIDANPLAVELIGLPREEIVGRLCHEFICPAERGDCPISDLDQTVDQSEHVLLTANGEKIPIIKTVASATWQGRKYYVESFIDITCRKKAEEALHESEQRYRNLIEHMSSGVVVYEPIDTGNDFVIRDFNPAGENIERVDRKDVIGKRVTEAFPGVKELGILDVFKRVWETGKTEYFPDSLYKDKRSCEGWRENWVYKLPTGEVVAVYNDITERKQTEEALRVSERKYSDLVQQSPDAVISLDKTGNFLSFNPAAERMSGFSAQEVLGRHFTKIGILAKESIPKALKEFGLVLTGAEHPPFELIITRKDKSRLFMEANGRLIKQKGQKTWIQVTLRDITKRKEAEQALNKSENLLRTIINAASDAMISIGEDGLINLFNPAAEKMFGHKREEMIGEPLDCLIPEQYRQQHQQYIKSYFTTGKPDVAIGNTLELPALRREGNVFPIELSLSAGVADNKQFVIAVARDIRERKRAEEELERLNKDLESTNQELTRTNEELKEFAYITAHDLKTPLRGIGTLADWISTDYADKFDEQGKEQVRLLTTKAKQMSALIDDILQYSRLGQGDQEEQQVDFNAVLSEVIAEIDPPENIEITIENELPALTCEKTQIMQVFQNLLSNAVKYTDKPEGQIKVGCAEQGEFWEFSVSDDGPGIEQKHFERIFKIFQTLSPREGVESTGIGLSIVKKITEMNGGRVWVESKRGEGSTFFFTLPKQMGVGNAERLQADSLPSN
jgi:PAS domain S-box-containing protein